MTPTSSKSFPPAEEEAEAEAEEAFKHHHPRIDRFYSTQHAKLLQATQTRRRSPTRPAPASAAASTPHPRPRTHRHRLRSTKRRRRHHHPHGLQFSLLFLPLLHRHFLLSRHLRPVRSRHVSRLQHQGVSWMQLFPASPGGEQQEGTQEAAEEELPGSEAAALGQMGRRNPRPETGHSGLARHVQHGRGGGPRLRQGRNRVSRGQSEAQFPVSGQLIVDEPRNVCNAAHTSTPCPEAGSCY